MHRSFSDLLELFKEAYSHTKALITIGLTFLTLLGTTDFTKDLLRSIIFGDAPPQAGGDAMILGAPGWMWGLAVFLLLLFFWMTQAALRLKKALTPELALDFRPEAEGIVKTRTEVLRLDGRMWVKVRDDFANYIRITLICRSEKSISNCAAYITKLEKGTIQGGDFREIPLRGSISINPIPLGTSTPIPIEVHPRITNVIDFLKVGQENKLEGSTPWPFRLEGAIDDEATYRFTIQVISAGIAKDICVAIVWTGRWDAITGYKVSAA
jgi:hypothetical protein